MNAQPNNFIVVMTTCQNDEEATLLAHKLIEYRLAACVQASRIKSVYRWQGVIETSEEVRLMIKARAEDY